MFAGSRVTGSNTRCTGPSDASARTATSPEPYGQAEVRSDDEVDNNDVFGVLFLVTGWLGLAVRSAEPVEEEPDYPHGDFSGDCSTCHSPEGWTPVDIGEDFDHTEVSGFALRYSHAQTRCSACHATLDFSATDPSCASCHADVHRAELGADCGRCHSTRSFIDPTTMTNAHLATRFPLRGTHRTLDCEDCHTPGGAGGLQWVNTPSDCLACHQDAYQATTNPDHVAGGFPETCEQCHSSTMWRPAGFNHQTIPAGAACVDCHLANCQATTNPDHLANNFPDTCDQCHTTTAWIPASFNHNAIPPGTRCVDCHLAEYQASTNPDHLANNFPDTCDQCHTTNAWIPGELQPQRDPTGNPVRRLSPGELPGDDRSGSPGGGVPHDMRTVSRDERLATGQRRRRKPRRAVLPDLLRQARR